MNRLNMDKLYGEIVVLMTYCATANIEYLSSNECANRFKNILEIIKQYKDIEDELGIDLITLFKALKNGVYRWHIDVYGDYNKNFIKKVFQDVELDISSKKLYHISEISGTPTWELKLKDYGKTWALTKEELE